mgnify:CR=1 FL=1
MVEILFEKNYYNNSVQNEIGYWLDCGTERGIHYETDCYENFYEWYSDALRNFTDWYVSCRIRMYNININSEMVYDVIQLEGSNYLNDFETLDEFNKYILVVSLNDYLQDEENINVNKFKNAMKENYDSINEDDE